MFYARGNGGPTKQFSFPLQFPTHLVLGPTSPKVVAMVSTPLAPAIPPHHCPRASSSSPLGLEDIHTLLLYDNIKDISESAESSRTFACLVKWWVACPYIMTYFGGWIHGWMPSSRSSSCAKKYFFEVHSVHVEGYIHTLTIGITNKLRGSNHGARIYMISKIGIDPFKSPFGCI